MTKTELRTSTLRNLIDAHVNDLQPEDAKEILRLLKKYIERKIDRLIDKSNAEFQTHKDE